MFQDTNKRRMLRIATKLMAGIGMLALVAVLLLSVPGRNTRPAPVDSTLLSTTGIQPGHVKYSLWQQRPVIIHHRSQDNIQALQQATQILADATSQKSVQPRFANVAQRSHHSDWFVAWSNGTDLNCPIELLGAGGAFKGKAWLGGFVDTCRGSRYDFAGRVFEGQYADRNLAIPAYSIKPDGSILLGGSQ